MSMMAATVGLADPDTRGEDLVYNYRLATAIAPQRCNGCARYHINWALARLARLGSPYGSDEQEFADQIDRALSYRASLPGPIAISILGAAETGIPALVAHAAVNAGIVDRAEFVVIDICDTPLQLCRDFGERHRLRLRTVEADLVALEGCPPADIIVAHSLLRFIPVEARLDCLRRWQRWLKPGGRLIVSNTFAPQTGRDLRSPFTEGLRDLVERDAIELAEPKERFLARLAQPPPWPITAMSEADLVGLFHQTGFRTVRRTDTTSTSAQDRGRMIAVFEAT